MKIRNIELIKELLRTKCDSFVAVFNDEPDVSVQILEKDEHETLAETIEVPTNVVIIRSMIDNSFTDDFHKETFDDTGIKELIECVYSNDVAGLICVASIVAAVENTELDLNGVENILESFRKGEANRWRRKITEFAEEALD